MDGQPYSFWHHQHDWRHRSAYQPYTDISRHAYSDLHTNEYSAAYDHTNTNNNVYTRRDYQRAHEHADVHTDNHQHAHRYSNTYAVPRHGRRHDLRWRRS